MSTMKAAIYVEPGRIERAAQRCLVVGPELGAGGEEDVGHQRGLWIWALCTSPKATISTSIAEPP